MEPNSMAQVDSILLATMAGAMIVLAGALYAAAFTMGKITDSATFDKLAYLFYGILLVSVLILARTLNFSGFWNWVALVMVVGYFAGPRIIYRLCVATHADETEPENAIKTENSSVEFGDAQ